MKPKVVIIGSGPTGLGAAYRLKELGYENFAIYDKNPHIGGLASSFKMTPPDSPGTSAAMSCSRITSITMNASTS